MPEILPQIETFARIKVVGCGGGGGNAVNRMVASKLRGIEFIAMNTDGQALHFSQAGIKVHIGRETTKGLGAGANPDIGRSAAEESEEDIYAALRNAEMVFITGGAGGGTASGAMPIIAKVAHDIGALTVAIVTKPFTFEGERRRKVAEAAIEELKDRVDTLIVIPNDRILQLIDRKTSLLDAFGVVDDILRQGVQGISDLITINGLINLDFADVKAIMSNSGSALMGIGHGSGDNRAVEAAKQAMDSPLLEVSIQGAKGVLINFTGGRDMGMHEIEEAAKLIHESVDPEANIIWGTVLDENVNNEIKVTLVATGFDANRNRLVSSFGTNLSSLQSSNLNRDDRGGFGDLQHHHEPETVPTPFVSNATPRAILDDSIVPIIKDEETPAIEYQMDNDLNGDIIELDVEQERVSSDRLGDSKPIVETISSNFEDVEDDLDKPAFLRQGKSVSAADASLNQADTETSDASNSKDHKPTKSIPVNQSSDSSEMPSFIKKKLE